jgi:hypothetical protein
MLKRSSISYFSIYEGSLLGPIASEGYWYNHTGSSTWHFDSKEWIDHHGNTSGIKASLASSFIILNHAIIHNTSLQGYAYLNLVIRNKIK